MRKVFLSYSAVKFRGRHCDQKLVFPGGLLVDSSSGVQANINSMYRKTNRCGLNKQTLFIAITGNQCQASSQPCWKLWGLWHLLLTYSIGANLTLNTKTMFCNAIVSCMQTMSWLDSHQCFLGLLLTVFNSESKTNSACQQYLTT